MLQKFELRFWDVFTPMLTSIQTQIYRVRHPRAHSLQYPGWLLALKNIDFHAILPLTIFCATSGFLAGSVLYLIIFAATRL